MKLVESRVVCVRCGDVETLDPSGVCSLCIAEERLVQAERDYEWAKSELALVQKEIKEVSK